MDPSEYDGGNLEFDFRQESTLTEIEKIIFRECDEKLE